MRGYCCYSQESHVAVHLPYRRPGDRCHPAGDGHSHAEVRRRRAGRWRQPHRADVGAWRGGFPDALHRHSGDPVRRAEHCAGRHGGGHHVQPRAGHVAGTRRRAGAERPGRSAGRGSAARAGCQLRQRLRRLRPIRSAARPSSNPAFPPVFARAQPHAGARGAAGWFISTVDCRKPGLRYPPCSD